MKYLSWIALAPALLLLVINPMALTGLLGVALAFAAIGYQILRGWRFIAPERGKLMRGLAQSIEQGPVASGLVPLLSAWMLCLLVVAAAFGVRL